MRFCENDQPTGLIITHWASSGEHGGAKLKITIAVDQQMRSFPPERSRDT